MFDRWSPRFRRLILRQVAGGSAFLVAGSIGITAYASNHPGVKLQSSVVTGAVVGFAASMITLSLLSKLPKRRAPIAGVAIAAAILAAAVRGLIPSAIPFVLAAGSTFMFLIPTLAVIAQKRIGSAGAGEDADPPNDANPRR